MQSKPVQTIGARIVASARTLTYGTLVLIACYVAGADFVAQRKVEPLYPSIGLTKVDRLSKFLPSLRDTDGDSDIYFFEGREPGGTLLVLGGTHPNEPAGYLSAVLMIENISVERGRVIVIPRANASGFTATEPQEAFPGTFEIINRSGKVREFRVGSRFTNWLDGWPDPIIYRHFPSEQVLSGAETRNLNRAYPGRPNGTLTERMAYAIAEVARKENADLVVDLHEAAPEYPVINAIVAHERAMDVAALATVDLQVEGLDFNLEPSPENFRGLIHRELGDSSNARVMLFESAGALQGRLRGRTDQELVLRSVDKYYTKAGELGKLKVPFPEEGIPLEIRVGRHLEALGAICRVLNDFEPDRTIAYSRIPGYTDIKNRGIEFYLQ